MFKMPTKERMQLIMDMVPEMVAVFTQEGKGYNARISQMGELMRAKDLCRELGITFSIIEIAGNLNVKMLMSLLEKNDVPEFAVVISKIGRYHVAFAGEDSPAVQLTREFGIPCIDGKIYVYQKEVTKRDAKRMFASGACSAYHLNTEVATLFHS